MTEKKKIYISGKITGLDIEVARGLFNEAEQVLAGQGYEVLNPMVLVPFQADMTWKEYMVEDIRHLLDCDAIYMLSNWKDSQGARVEHAIAVEMKMGVFLQ